MLSLKNEVLAYCVGEEEAWQQRKNGEKSCWPGSRQIDSSIDFPFTVTVHPSLLWLHWPISEKNSHLLWIKPKCQKRKHSFCGTNKWSRMKHNLQYRGRKRLCQFKCWMLVWERKKQRVLVPCWESNNFPQWERLCLVGPCIVNFNPNKRGKSITMIAILFNRQQNRIMPILQACNNI